MRTSKHAWIRAVFRRDRLTGQIAIGLTGVLVVGAVVFGIGVASARYTLADIGAWLSAGNKGMAVHANGLAGRVDGKAELIRQMRGHRIKIVQDGGAVLIVDQDTGVVSRIDPSQLKVSQSRAFGAPGLQVVVGGGRAYTVDATKGGVQRIDPVTLSAIGQPATLSPPLGQAGIDARGTLWVPAPQSGQVVPFQDGRQLAPATVGSPGDRLALTIADGQPVITNSTAASATVIKSSGSQLKTALPSTVRRSGPAGVLAPAQTEGRIVPLLAREAGSLILLDTGNGTPSPVKLKLPRHRLATPQVLGSRVYIPDETAGALLVYNSATNAFEPQLRVTGRPSSLDVFVKDGLLWAHNPNDSRAIVVDRKDGVKQIEKYDDKVPGGQRRPIPTQGDPRGGRGNPNGGGRGGGGREDGGSPSGIPQRPPPRPDQPPTAPANLRVTPGTGTMTVDFQPSLGGRPTGYVLKDTAGLTVTPARLAPDSGTHTFQVTGGKCQTEYRFRVAVTYKDDRGAEAEVVSQPSDPVRPCVPPGAPSAVSGTATAQGAKVTWTAPQGTTSTPVTYGLTWTGAKSGSRSGVTGTSATLGEVWKNGSYTFTVTSANGAGAGQRSSWTGALTGPTTRYAVRNNGKSNGKVNQRPDTASPDVAVMFDNNGELVPVHCQARGTYFAHSNGDPNFAGDMYAKITYAGKQGYTIGYLISTPGSWKSFAGPTVWEC